MEQPVLKQTPCRLPNDHWEIFVGPDAFLVSRTFSSLFIPAGEIFNISDLIFRVWGFQSAHLCKGHLC